MGEEEGQGGRRRRNGAKRQRTTRYRSFTLDDVDVTIPQATTKSAGTAALSILAQQENIAPVSQNSKAKAKAKTKAKTKITTNTKAKAEANAKAKATEKGKRKGKGEDVHSGEHDSDRVRLESSGTATGDVSVEKGEGKKRKAVQKVKSKKHMKEVEEDEAFADDDVDDDENEEEDEDEVPISIEEAFPYLKKELGGNDAVDDLENELSKKDSKSLSHAEHYQKYKLLKLRQKIDKNHKVTDLEFVFAVVSEVVQLEVEKASGLPDEEKQLQQQALEQYLESVRSELNVCLNRGEDYYQVIQEYKDAKQRVANARQSILEEEKENRLLNTLLAKERALYLETKDKTKSDKAVQVFIQGIERIVKAGD